MKKKESGVIQKQIYGSVLLGICVVIGLSGCGNDQKTSKDETEAEKNGTSIYLVAMDEGALDDGTEVENIGCDDALVEVKINKKLSPQEALEALFDYTTAEDGLYNVFSMSPNLQIEKMIVANDFAIVTLSKDLVTGGMCDGPRVPAQIRKTLMQFDEIDGVDIFVGDEEVSSYLSEKDDYDNAEFVQ